MSVTKFIVDTSAMLLPDVTSVEFLEAPRYCFSIIKTQTYIGVLFITLREIHS